MFQKVCLIVLSSSIVIFFVSTSPELNIIAKFSHVNKNKGVADLGPLIRLLTFVQEIKLNFSK